MPTARQHMCEASEAHPDYTSAGGLGVSNQQMLEKVYENTSTEGAPTRTTQTDLMKGVLGGEQLDNTSFAPSVNMDYGHADLPEIKWPEDGPTLTSFGDSSGEAGGPSTPFTPNLMSPGAHESAGTTNFDPPTPGAALPLPGHFGKRVPESDPSTSSPVIGGQDFTNLNKGEST